MQQGMVVIAGASGNLGGRLARALRARGAEPVALVRRGTAPEKVERLRQMGAHVAEVDTNSVDEVAAACAGAECVVSALLGLREVMVEAQTVLLDGALRAGVPRFIPSDYSLDFTKLRPGENRNLDLHRDFQERLEKTGIQATSVLNGAFADMLTGQAPLVLFRWKRVLYWGSADQLMDFTTIDDTAAYTAAAALDAEAPRFLRIAGEQISARGLAALMGELSGKRYRLLRAGSLGMLGMMIKVARRVSPGGQEVFPAWQGMQYMHNMFEGRAKLQPLNNDRYPGMRWTPVREVLAARV